MSESSVIEPGTSRAAFSFSRSRELFQRAGRVIPGGIYGSKTPGFVVPGSYPYFLKDAKGSRFTDVDGNEYIDFLCGYGSQILGYGNPVVDGAAIARIPHGNLLNQPGEVMVQLAERLVGQIAGMDWSVFAKNGSDVTNLAVDLARVHTNRRIIIRADGAYHGTGNWCNTNDFPVLQGKSDIKTFPYNDEAALTDLFVQNRGEIAALILTPYHHRTFDTQIMPDPGFLIAARRLCDAEGALFIMDDIRANFRLDLHGSHVAVGADPDLVCMGKCLTNGHPLAVLMGKNAVARTATRFFITGTYWTATVPMVAALAALDQMESLDILTHMNRIGTRLADGLREAGREAGLPARVTGPPTIPFLTFDDDPDLYSNQVFCADMTRNGIYMHPHHNWFISYAHSDDDIDRTLELSRASMRLLAEKRSDADWPLNV